MTVGDHAAMSLKLALCIVGTAHVTATIVTFQIHLNRDLGGKSTGTWMFGEATLGPSANKLDCAKLCVFNASCVSFAFHNVSRACRFYAAAITKYNGLVNAPGYVTYHTSKASAAFGIVCTANSVCLLANSVCVNNTCQCQPGGSYDPRRRVCVEDCTEYGAEYTPFTSYFMDNVPNKAYTDLQSLTVAGCAARCYQVKTPVCRSFELHIADRTCYVQEATPWKLPQNYKPKNGGVTYFQRHCKFL